MDVDSDRVLWRCDLHLHKKYWIDSVGIKWPGRFRSGNILVARASLEQDFFDLPVNVFRDRSAECLRVEIGNQQPDAFITLSEGCVALLAETELVGFLLRRVAGLDFDE
jgi:hypothetical protein